MKAIPFVERKKCQGPGTTTTTHNTSPLYASERETGAHFFAHKYSYYVFLVGFAEHARTRRQFAVVAHASMC